MTDATDRARKLLAAAEARTGWYPAFLQSAEAQNAIRDKAPATLAVAVRLAEYAQGQKCEFRVPCHDAGLNVDHYCERCKALAEWEGLLKEEEANA